MKKLLSILIVITLIVTCAGCLSTNSDSGKKAVETVENFLNALSQLDGLAMKKCISDESVIDSVPFADSGSFSELVLSNFPVELEEYKSNFAPVIATMEEKITSCMSYEILGVETNGDSYDVFAEYIIPANLDMITDRFSKLFSGDNLVIVLESLLNDGVITDSTTEEELMPAIVDAIVEQAITMVDEVEFEAKETQVLYTVSEFDGKWLIIPD